MLDWKFQDVVNSDMILRSKIFIVIVQEVYTMARIAVKIAFKMVGMMTQDAAMTDIILRVESPVVDL